MALNDGSIGAASGAAQLGDVLAGYAVRPSWQVAGVDYAVGPTSTTLKDPSTISMAGVSVDNNSRTITVTGDNITLDEYDFSMHGGYQLVISGSNAVVSDSKFKIGTNTGIYQIDVLDSASNPTIKYCDFDGSDIGNAISLIASAHQGMLTLQYNSFHNVPSSPLDLVQANGSPAFQLDYKYNVIEQGGIAPGSHMNFLQFGGGTATSVDVEFNTSYQTPQVSGGEGFQFYDNTPGGTILNTTMAYNTMIATGGSNGSAVSYFVHPGSGNGGDSGSIHDNFFDVSAAWGAFYTQDIGSGWSLSNNVDMRSGKVISSDNSLSGTASTNPPATPTATPPAAPTIASFSTDTGVAGDGVTNDNALELKGAAAAGSTVKIYDGSTQIGSTTATSTGSWDYITKVLTEAKHTLTATATNASGQTSAASAAVAVTVDTKAPAAPTIAKDTVNSSNQAVVSGSAEANSTIKVYDGTTQVGTATTNSSGAWGLTTSALSTGSHVLTAKATDLAGNVSAASAGVDPVIGSGTSGSTGSGTSGSGTSGSGTSGTGTSGTGSTAPAAPKIASFSTDSGVAGDHITSDKTLTLAGTAAANSTVKVFDGTSQLGIVTADANGGWHYSTAALPDGKHSLTATDTVSGVTSKASAALDVTVDTAAPHAPVLLSDPTTHNHATVSGTAEAGSSIKLYEGTSLLGTATVADDGDWSVTTPNLKHGSHTFTATATDAAGNTSALSQPIDPPIGSHSANGPSTVELTNVRAHWDHTATIKGTAGPNSEIKLSDGTTSAGSVTAGADGKWSFHTSDLSGKTHAFTAEQVDTTGHVVGTSSGEAIIGSGHRDTLTGTTGNDVMVGKRGADTFEFASNFGQDVIKDFAARGPAHDAIEFSKGVFDSFASVLSHAAQSGHDVVIATGSDTLTLKNMQLDKLNSHDFHFA